MTGIGIVLLTSKFKVLSVDTRGRPEVAHASPTSGTGCATVIS